jgi:hypothetical protein
MTLYQATLYHNADPILTCTGQTRLWALLGLGEKVLKEHHWLAQEYGHFPWRELAHCFAQLRRSRRREAQHGQVRIELEPTHLPLRRRRPGEPSASAALRRAEHQFHELGLDYELR